MKKFIIFVLVVIAILIINKELFISYCCKGLLYKYDGSDLFKDTTINKVTIDSVQFNIIVKDSIINNLKYEKHEELEKVEHICDTDAVKLFKQLVSE